MVRAAAGSLIGAGAGVALVYQTHGNLRIGLSPLVQVAEAVGAAAAVHPCKPSHSDNAACRAAVSGGSGNARQLGRDAAAAGMIGGYAALHVYLNREWWSATPAKHWFVANDWDQNERDEDKFDHFLGGFRLTRVTSELLQAGCVPGTRAVALAALYAWAFQFQIEEWDGTQQIYGFNPSDLIADASGALFAVAQQHSRVLRYISGFSYHPTQAYRRRNEPGHFGQPRATTDYAGQTYSFSMECIRCCRNARDPSGHHSFDCLPDIRLLIMSTR